MNFSPHEIVQTTEGVRVRAGRGDVLLRKDRHGIDARYLGQQLVNGSAQAYAENVREAALRYARDYPLPWSVDPAGGMRIQDHRGFYQQTFHPALAGIETLALWQAEAGACSV